MVEKRRSLPEAERAPVSPDGHQRKKRTLEDGRPMSVDMPTPPRAAIDEIEAMDVDEEPTQKPETPPAVANNSTESAEEPSSLASIHEHGIESTLIPDDASLVLRHMLPVLSTHPRIVTPSINDALDYEWRVVWYPSGFVDSDYVSVFVQMVTNDGELQPGESETVRHAEIEVTLVNEKDPSGKSNYVKVSAAHSFCRESPEFGISKFVRRSKLLDPERGFLAHDSRVRVDINLNFVAPDPIVIATDDSALSADHDAMALAAQALGLGPHAVSSLEAASTSLEDDRDSAESVQHLLAYDSKEETGMVGLKNQGATCYLNSLLQTLFHLRAFRQVVYDTPTQNEDTTNSVSLALQRVFYRLQVQNKAVSTKELTRSFGWSQIDSFMQHDVQELYRILCDRLEEKMKNTNVDSAIKKLFEGKVRSFVRCVDVDFQSFRDESFYDLQLDVKGCKDIYQSLRKYVEIELLQGDNQYEAEGFGKQDAKKGISFLQMPPVLNIQLKRYEYDPMRDGMFKIHDRFEYPKTLVLDEFLQNGEVAGASPDKTPATEGGATKPKHVYHLHSVLVHSGDVHGGHYYVFIRPGKDISNSCEWFRFDDDQITRVDENVAIEGNFGSAPSTAIDTSRPSSPLSLGGGSSREESGLEFRSMDAPTPEDTSNSANGIYEYNKEQGTSGGPRAAPFLSAESSISSGLTIPLVRSFSSAYMLVYVRDGNNDISAIADSSEPTHATGSQDVEMGEPSGEVDGDALCVPNELVERFQKEEKAAARRKKQQQTEHLFMNLRIASDTSVSNLRRYTKNADFSAFSNSACLRIRMKRTGPIRELYHRIYRRTGVPVARQRLWKVITRENRTHRPDQPLLANTLDFRVGSLIDDDASPKAPVRLYLQILSSSKPTKPVIHRHLWHEFYPPESESEKEEGVDDELDAEEETESEHSKNVGVDADSVGCCQVPLHEHEILLFIKFYDLKRSLPERLRYVGNIVIDSRKTGAQLSKFLHEALDISPSKDLILYEEIQPVSIQEIDMNTSLVAAEIQHGDIICFQFAEDEAESRGSLVINPELIVDEDASDALGDSDVKLVPPEEDEGRALDDALVPGTGKVREKYPDVPSYFRYLLDRVEIVFQQYGHPEDKFVLELLNSNVYDEIVDAVAKHLDMTDKRLFLRLYQHSPLNGLPMKNPLRHAQYSGDTRTTLEDFLSEYLERTTTMYYEVLPCPITEIEAKKQVLVYLSVYDECFTHGHSHGQMHRVEFLVTATDTVNELKELVREHFELPAAVKLRISAVVQHGSLITDVLDEEESLSRFWAGGASGSTTSAGSNDASALFVECVLDEEDAQKMDSKDTSNGEPNERFVKGVTHFNFQANSQTWIHPHGVPLTVAFREQETVAQVKERIRRRLGVSTDVFEHWNFALVKDLKASTLSNVLTEIDPEALDELPMEQLEDVCGDDFGNISGFGLEHADPTPKTGAPRHREQGIRIRQN